MGEPVTLDEALALVRQLSPVDKARLIERVAPDLERELRATRSASKIQLRGLWRGLKLTEEEIDGTGIWKHRPDPCAPHP